MSDPIRLCALEDLNETGACSVNLKLTDEEVSLVVVLDREASRPNAPEARAYYNECPHLLTPLDMFPDEFLDKENPSLLVCSTHGARFQVSDGLCIVGPCIGANLESVEVTVREGEIFLIQPEA
ncbi:Rieske 2Fe-2S domain-containing protein [uncultured Cohaesibacter sp.]|uniref:Rieske (2Fe-2S) protein n=1 Tax=uncultured Cohaesibacter sp. TaxID=1002546 RepID=UPI0029C98705|nr:Rieske 2Fe-2S domain-containing protein [uncultured Cohaesibacter sp.]